jgi:amino acid transporter
MAEHVDLIEPMRHRPMRDRWASILAIILICVSTLIALVFVMSAWDPQAADDDPGDAAAQLAVIGITALLWLIIVFPSCAAMLAEWRHSGKR